MITDVLAIGYLIASQLIISVFFFIVSRKQLMVALATMYSTIDEKIQSTVDGIGKVIGEVFGEIFEKPTVKKAFGIIGSQGGTANANRDLTEKIAMDVLNGPKFAGLKLIAEGLGMNLDEYIEGHGAVNTFNSIQSLSGMIPGLNLGSVIGGGSNLAVGHEANHDNPYLAGRR